MTRMLPFSILSLLTTPHAGAWASGGGSTADSPGLGPRPGPSRILSRICIKKDEVKQINE